MTNAIIKKIIIGRKKANKAKFSSPKTLGLIFKVIPHKMHPITSAIMKKYSIRT